MIKIKCKKCSNRESISCTKVEDLKCVKCNTAFSFWEEKYFVLLNHTMLKRLERRRFFCSRLKTGNKMILGTQESPTFFISVETLEGSAFLSPDEITLLANALSLELETEASTEGKKFSILSSFGVVESVNEELVELVEN